MISEKEFTEDFTGFWAECLPFLTPQLVGEMNLRGLPIPNSKGFVVKPMKSGSHGSNNDIAAETAFGLFAAAATKGSSVYSISKDEAAFKSIADAAADRIRALRGIPVEGDLTVTSLAADAIELAARLERYVDRNFERVIIQPRFKGCGILDSCYGDLLCDDSLHEVKMVDRNLRSVDLRQVLTYCALNYQSRQFKITTLCVVNPRRGIVFPFELETLAQRAAKKSSAELFHQIGDFLGNFEAIHQAS